GLDVGTGADVPTDRRQRLVVAARATGLIGAAAGFLDRSVHLDLGLGDRGGGLEVGAAVGRWRQLARDDRALALHERLRACLHVLGRRLGDRGLALHRVGAGDAGMRRDQRETERHDYGDDTR